MKNRKYRKDVKSLQYIYLESEHEKWQSLQAAQATIDNELEAEQRRQDRKAYVGAALMCLATGAVVFSIIMIASQLNF